MVDVIERLPSMESFADPSLGFYPRFLLGRLLVLNSDSFRLYGVELEESEPV